MKLTMGTHKDQPCMELSGKIGRDDVMELEITLAQEVKRAKDVLIVDLAGVEVAASGAISAVVDASTKMGEKGGALKIYDPQPKIMELFKRLGLHQTLKFFRSSRHRPDPGPPTKLHR